MKKHNPIKHIETKQFVSGYAPVFRYTAPAGHSRSIEIERITLLFDEKRQRQVYEFYATARGQHNEFMEPAFHADLRITVSDGDSEPAVRFYGSVSAREMVYLGEGIRELAGDLRRIAFAKLQVFESTRLALAAADSLGIKAVTY